LANASAATTEVVVVTGSMLVAVAHSAALVVERHIQCLKRDAAATRHETVEISGVAIHRVLVTAVVAPVSVLAV